MSKYLRENRVRLHTAMQRVEILRKLETFSNIMSNNGSKKTTKKRKSNYDPAKVKKRRADLFNGSGSSKIVKKEELEPYNPAKARAARAKRNRERQRIS